VETIAVSDAFARAHRLVADRVVMIDVRDSSMSPTLEQGDQVIVDRSVDSLVEDGVYAIHQAGSLRIRRLQNRGDGSILVLSDNASYRPEVVGASEIAQHLVVIGRVLPFKFGRVRL
jgi:phage repressor protein C with HTH and peptisase S24 domain